MGAAKITLSPKELELVNNADWILTKNLIIEKVYELFGLVAASYQTQYQNFTTFENSEVFSVSPKISKGEQYRGLPYVMLDFPRYYGGQDFFGIRTFFWWGNHSSIHLVLKGKFLASFGPSISRYFQLMGKSERNDWFIGVGSDPWQHHFDTNNYISVEQWGGQNFADLPFLKLAKKIPLEEWDDMEQFLVRHFNRILSMASEY